MTAGLTGGIASGKSTVAAMMASAGARVLDADTVAHALLREERVVSTVVARFGPDVLGDGAALDRRRLGKVVFSDPVARSWLESLLHPLVWAELDIRVASLENGDSRSPVVVEVPLLVECGCPGRFGPLILAWCKRETQIERLIRRDGLDAEEAEARLAAQLPLDEKLAFASHVIDTSSGIEDTERQVRPLMARLRGPVAD